VKRRSLLFACAALALAACSGGSGPRALVLADGSGPSHAMGVSARVKLFQDKTGRQVKILPVAPDQALALASRGEADVALLPRDLSLDKFLASEHGSVVGLFTHQGEGVRVVEVNAKQHPKVDAQGAHDLASAMAAP
jgi:ABC-type tungstate transport system permease subunit